MGNVIPQKRKRGRPKGSINRKGQEFIEVAAMRGILPLEYMLQVLRDENLDRAERFAAAKEAAPYLHPKLSSVEANVKQTIVSQDEALDLIEDVLKEGDPSGLAH